MYRHLIQHQLYFRYKENPTVCDLFLTFSPYFCLAQRTKFKPIDSSFILCWLYFIYLSYLFTSSRGLIRLTSIFRKRKKKERKLKKKKPLASSSTCSRGWKASLKLAGLVEQETLVRRPSCSVIFCVLYKLRQETGSTRQRKRSQPTNRSISASSSQTIF